jgi:hypothetical protein
MEDKVAKPVVNPAVISQAGDAAGPNTVPPHLQPTPLNQRGLPTEEGTEADKLHPKEVNVTDDQGYAGPTDHYATSPLFYEVANYFGVEQGDFDVAKEKLSVIVDHVIQSSGSDKAEDILVELRKLEDQIQPPAWDEKRYNNLYKYIRLAMKHDAFGKALGAFRRDGGKGLNGN